MSIFVDMSFLYPVRVFTCIKQARYMEKVMLHVVNDNLWLSFTELNPQKRKHLFSAENSSC